MPEREEVAEEIQRVTDTFRGRCSWREATKGHLQEIYKLGEGAMKKKPSKATWEKNLVFKYTKQWPRLTRGRRPARGENLGPVEVVRDKYSRQEGGFSRARLRRLSLPREYEEIVKGIANASLSRNTWKAYSTAERSAERCEIETGLSLRLPWREREASLFIAWAVKKNLCASTIRQYLAGIKSAHIREGWSTGGMDSKFVKTLAKGRENSEMPRKQKVAMSGGLLLALKRGIIRSKLKYKDKLLLWAVSLLMFSASLRASEILGEEEDSFDSRNTLMGRDVRIKVMKAGPNRRKKMVACVIRNPKEIRGTAELEVEAFEIESLGSPFCPVKAVEKLQAARGRKENLPFATRSNGKIMTKRWFNATLKELLKNAVDYEKNVVSSHSFRSGVATMMARAGYSDQDIKRQGRWKSDAFLSYIRLGRSQRLEQQEKLARDLARVSRDEEAEMRRQRGSV